jgi:hypothetical protein
MDKPDQRLLLSKYLYTRGTDELRAGDPFSAGLAVSLFQDAVEMVLFTCSARFDAQVKDRAGFAELWDAVNKAVQKASKPPLPLGPQMQAVNKVRVGFKHYGLRPDSRDAESCRADCGQFLELVARNYLDLDFAALSIASVVREDAERALLERAVDALRTDDKATALAECARALDLIQDRRESFYRHGILVQLGGIDHETKKYVDSQIGALRRHIWDLENFIFCGMCGVSPMDVMVLRSVLPTLQGDDAKFEQLQPAAIAPAAVERCIDLIAKYSLGLSYQLAAPSRIAQGAEWLF